MKIQTLKNQLARASKAEIVLSGKISRALAARRINFDRLHRLQAKHLAALRAIGAAELAVFLRSLFAPSPFTPTPNT